MTTLDTASGDPQATRRHLLTMAGMLILVLVVLAVIALYGLDRIRREADGFAAATGRLIEATELAREAQVAFKAQVQEWQNVLLRGDDPKDFASYRQAFHDRGTAVVERVRRARDRGAELGMATGPTERILAMHAELAGRYAEALAGFGPGAAEASRQVDNAVRDTDRRLDEALNTLVTEVRQLAAARRADAEAAMAQVNADQRRILIVAHTAGIALVAVSLLVALRALRRR